MDRGAWLSTPWTEEPGRLVARAPLFMGFSRQEHWSGLSCPPSGDLPDPVFKPAAHVSPALTFKFFTTEPPGKPFDTYIHTYICIYTYTCTYMSIYIYTYIYMLKPCLVKKTPKPGHKEKEIILDYIMLKWRDL